MKDTGKVIDRHFFDTDAVYADVRHIGVKAKAYAIPSRNRKTAFAGSVVRAEHVGYYHRGFRLRAGKYSAVDKLQIHLGRFASLTDDLSVSMCFDPESAADNEHDSNAHSQKQVYEQKQQPSVDGSHDDRGKESSGKAKQPSNDLHGRF